MNKGVVIAIVLLLIGVAGVQSLQNYKAKSDFGDRIERQLDMVDEASFQLVAQDLVGEAKKLGIKVGPEDIQIRYEDTDIQSYAQKLVGSKLGAQFKNKRVTIGVLYKSHVLLIPLTQEIIKEKVRQVEAPRMPVNKATQELLDAN